MDTLLNTLLSSNIHQLGYEVSNLFNCIVQNVKISGLRHSSYSAHPIIPRIPQILLLLQNDTCPYPTMVVPKCTHTLNLISRLSQQTKSFPPHTVLPLTLIPLRRLTPTPYQAPPITRLSRLTQITSPNHRLSLPRRNTLCNRMIGSKVIDYGCEIRPVGTNKDYICKRGRV